jgi:ribosome-binding protein aMBF1 (putative translation factor)
METRMSKEDFAKINPSVLIWAINRSGKTREDIAVKVNVKPSHLEYWEKGNALPFDKARKIADYLQIWLSFFKLAAGNNNTAPRF